MYDLIAKTAATYQLDIFGGFHPDPDDDILNGAQTLLLLGPKEPGFWPYFTTSPEYLDGTPNPVDRWSSRTVTALATAFNAQPYFPFTGPPYQPFFKWAERSGRCHQSPINLLVHDTAGLFTSFRGALGFGNRFDLPPAPPNPCDSCAERPCLTTCPVGALSEGVYDVNTCREAIGTNDPGNCLARGCVARRACPPSRAYGRLEAQSAYHMRMFLENGA
ncbi:ferredoxin [Shimia sediminis]|uniref:ferredoxin n=1 Tax=Shimia sediminis TaxID=2497945 RepID=UPI000F8D065F|nr:ferredoxin [Shimia sediminis]